MNEKNWGGARPGAGRPRKGTKQLTIYLPADIDALLDIIAAETKKPKATVVRNIIVRGLRSRLPDTTEEVT